MAGVGKEGGASRGRKNRSVPGSESSRRVYVPLLCGSDHRPSRCALTRESISSRTRRHGAEASTWTEVRAWTQASEPGQRGPALTESNANMFVGKGMPSAGALERAHTAQARRGSESRERRSFSLHRHSPEPSGEELYLSIFGEKLGACQYSATRRECVCVCVCVAPLLSVSPAPLLEAEHSPAAPDGAPLPRHLRQVALRRPQVRGR